MREILFRGKRLQGNDWVYGYFFKSDFNKRERESGKATLIFTPDCETFIMVPEWHNSLMVHADTVGQYTGLMDKNGVKIFEGDIVQYTFDNPKETITTENGLKIRYGRIFWSEWRGAWAVTVGNNCKINNDVYMYVRNGNRMQVIGTIYDNPELLND